MSHEMSERLPTPRSKGFARVAGFVAVAFLALSAVTSANAQPHGAQSRPPAASIYPWNLNGPTAPPARSYYPAPSSEIAPPMQEATPIAPLSAHPAPDYSGL
jgi:hypothetical protein